MCSNIDSVTDATGTLPFHNLNLFFRNCAIRGEPVSFFFFYIYMDRNYSNLAFLTIKRNIHIRIGAERTFTAHKDRASHDRSQHVQFSFIPLLPHSRVIHQPFSVSPRSPWFTVTKSYCNRRSQTM